MPASPETDPSQRWRRARPLPRENRGLRGRSPPDRRKSMKASRIAGLAGPATLGAHAQMFSPPNLPAPLESLVVTATRSLEPVATLRDTVVITRTDIEDAGPISL